MPARPACYQLRSLARPLPSPLPPVRTSDGRTRDGRTVAVPPPPTPETALQSRRTVRVIVELAAPRPARRKPGSAASRAAIADLQSAVIAAVFGSVGALRPDDDGGGRHRLQRMSSVPALAVNVDAAELARLRADPRVRSVVLDRRVYPHLDQSTRQIGMDAVWGRPARARGAGQAVAVVDTGVNLNHPFLAGKRIVAQACFSGSGNPARSLCPNGKPVQIGGPSGRNCPMRFDDDCEHGTHVAGIAAGFNTDYFPGEPRKGVAYQARIIAVQVFENDDDDLGASSSDILASLDWLYTNRKAFDVPLAAINMSLGDFVPVSGDCSSAVPAITQVIEQLRAAKIATVISSGNEGYVDALVWPACIDAAVAVGATSKATPDEPERMASYSNNGKLLDILAPGGDHRYPLDADFPLEILSSVPGKGYEALEGTSMAAPHIAGVFAAIRSAEGCERKGVGRILKALQRTGKTVRDVVYKDKRRADVAKAMGRLRCSGFGL